MRYVIVLLLGACAVPRVLVPANHPANPSAPAGRLAGPPPSLRAGAADYKDVPPLRKDEPMPAHHHHGQ